MNALKSIKARKKELVTLGDASEKNYIIKAGVFCSSTPTTFICIYTDEIRTAILPLAAETQLQHMQESGPDIKEHPKPFHNAI